MDPETLDAIAKQFVHEYERSEAHRRALTVIELATLSLLIDRGLLKVSEVTERIQQIHAALPESFREQAVLDRTSFVTQILQQVHGQKQPKWTPAVIEGGLDQDQKSDPDPR